MAKAGCLLVISIAFSFETKVQGNFCQTNTTILAYQYACDSKSVCVRHRSIIVRFVGKPKHKTRVHNERAVNREVDLCALALSALCARSLPGKKSRTGSARGLVLASHLLLPRILVQLAIS